MNSVPVNWYYQSGRNRRLTLQIFDWVPLNRQTFLYSENFSVKRSTDKIFEKSFLTKVELKLCWWVLFWDSNLQFLNSDFTVCRLRSREANQFDRLYPALVWSFCLAVRRRRLSSKEILHPALKWCCSAPKLLNQKFWWKETSKQTAYLETFLNWQKSLASLEISKNFLFAEICGFIERFWRSTTFLPHRYML